MADTEESPTVRNPLGQFLAPERDVLVLSLAMFAFSLGLPMTGRYILRYLHGRADPGRAGSAGVDGRTGSVPVREGNAEQVRPLAPSGGGALRNG